VIENFSKAKVLVIGDVMLDRYWWGSVNRISPEAPVPVINLQRTTTMPGGAANVALNVASLGAEVRMLSSVGTDSAGDELVSVLEERGLSTNGVVRVSSKVTSVKTRIIAHNQQVTRVDSEETEGLTSEYTEQIFELARSWVTGTDAVIISDYAKGTLTEELLSQVIQLARDRSKPLLVDPKGKEYRKYAGASVLTPNRREAAEACKLEESDPKVVEKAGAILLKELGLQYVLITEGEHGMTLFEPGQDPLHLDASLHEVYDVTGAGDSVIACLGVALAAGATMREACVFANVAGGISVEQVGTHAVTLAELRNRIYQTGR
jgi:D-beta-D-heptose 7-phosphate kinase / D-beta-D-heptose 1-phosphate adenosyltransferase